MSEKSTVVGTNCVNREGKTISMPGEFQILKPQEQKRGCKGRMKQKSNVRADGIQFDSQ